MRVHAPDVAEDVPFPIADEGLCRGTVQRVLSRGENHRAFSVLTRDGKIIRDGERYPAEKIHTLAQCRRTEPDRSVDPNAEKRGKFVFEKA